MKLKFSGILFVFLFMAIDLQGYSQQRIKDFYLSNFNAKGLRDWEVKGDEAIIHEKNVDIDKMNGKYYAKNDVISVSSKKATLNKETFDVFLRGDVRIENKEGAKLTTESLNWKKKENKIKTDDWVRIDRDATTITARGMEADTQIKTVNFSENVAVNIPEKKGSGHYTITCDGPLEVEYNEGKAIFHNNVIAEGKQGKMFSDKATVFFDSKEKKIIKIIAEGNVKIVKDENTTFAQKATYFGKEEKLIFEGSPRIIYFPKEENETP